MNLAPRPALTPRLATPFAAGSAGDRAWLASPGLAPLLELLDHRLQVAGTEDTQVVEQLQAGCKNEPLCDRVRPRRPVRQPQDLHAIGAEDLIEAGCELPCEQNSVPTSRNRAPLRGRDPAGQAPVPDRLLSRVPSIDRYLTICQDTSVPKTAATRTTEGEKATDLILSTFRANGLLLAAGDLLAAEHG